MPADMEVDKENTRSGGADMENKGTVAPAGAPARKKGESADDNREAFSPELLRFYYARLFPYEQVSHTLCSPRVACVVRQLGVPLFSL